MSRPIDQLRDAVVEQPDKKKIRYLIEIKKVDPNEQPSNRRNRVLYTATASNNIEIVKLLLQLGANPNLEATEGKGETSLYIAAKCAYAECIRLLLFYGAHPNHKHSFQNNWTPLHFFFHPVGSDSVENPYKSLKHFYLSEADLTAVDTDGKSPIEHAEKHASLIRNFIRNIDNYCIEVGKYWWNLSDSEDKAALPAIRAFLRSSSSDRIKNHLTGCPENWENISPFKKMPLEIVDQIREYCFAESFQYRFFRRGKETPVPELPNEKRFVTHSRRLHGR
jgi:hypothetical protein